MARFPSTVPASASQRAFRLIDVARALVPTAPGLVPVLVPALCCKPQVLGASIALRDE